MTQSTQFFLPTLISFLICLVLTPLIILLAQRFGFVDDPKRRHPAILHQEKIPRAGGVAMFLGFLVSALIFAQKDKYLLAISLGGFLNVIAGTLDDKYNLPPGLRLLVQGLSALIIVLSGVKIYVTNPFGEGILSFDHWVIPGRLGLADLPLPGALILIFWIVWMMNMINWSKGASQLSGVAFMAFLTLAGVALKYQAGNPWQAQTALLSFISGGAVLAFLPFNFPPERMLPGFGASTWIGFNLAVLAVLSGGKLAAAILVLGVPAVDAILVLLRRLLAGESPFRGDRSHFYHQLLQLGFTKRQVIFLYWIVTGVLGFLALNLENEGKLFALVMVTVLIAAGVLTVGFWLRYKKP